MNARWASIEEMKERVEGVNLKTGVNISGLPIMYDDKYLYIEKKDNHNLLIGSTGSGKTQAVILPMIQMSRMAEESIVVNDPKGELYKITAKKLEEEGYKTIVIDFFDPRYGNNWNPLTLPYKLYKEGNKDRAIDLIEDLGYYLLTDSREKDQDPFWINSTINYFVGLTIYLFENAKEEEINLSSIESLASSLSSKEKIKTFINEVANNPSIYLKVAGTLLAPEETKGSILSVFKQRLQKYLIKENLKNMMQTTDFDITKIQENKTAIFIFSGISNLCDNLIPLLINQIIDAVDLYETTKRRINMLLDEFDTLLPIKNFAQKIRYCRSLGIRMTVAIQSFIHLANRYSKEEVEILKMCFENIVYLLSEDIYTLQEISKYCGTIKDNNIEKPLVSPEELKTLKVFEAVIIMTRMMPFKTKLLPNYQINWGYKEEIAKIPERTINKIAVYNYEK